MAESRLGEQIPHGDAEPPRLLIFDVNETLSDMSSMAARFEDVGAPASLAEAWFAGLLRDGFALTVVGENPAFAELAAEGLRDHLSGASLDRDLDSAVAHVIAGFSDLGVHGDVADGLRRLAEAGFRLVTLSNGSASIAAGLLADAGVDDCFESFFSVEQAGIWKPAPGAYGYAVEQSGVRAGEAMLIAVHPWDTDGARRAGLASAWLNREGGRYPEYFLSPTMEAPSLPDLAQQLEARRG